MSTLQKRLEAFLQHLHDNAVAAPDDLLGCSDLEISKLEDRYSLTLPSSYRWYLATMGKKSGRLFTHDHMAVYYEHVMEMTDDIRSDAVEFPDEPSIDLPTDALVIAGRLSEQFQFIRCNDSDDSAVWYFNEYDYEIVKTEDSIVDWLESFCGDAEKAIANGYFDQYPNGTKP